MRKRLAAVLIVSSIGLGAVYWLRNPERVRLDNAARRAAPGRFVRLTDGLTHYQIEGPDTGQRVLLAHGFSVPSYIWDSTAVALTQAGFRVARYDYFGRGYSDRPDADYSIDFYDRQLTELLDSLGWTEPIDIVGLSMGGVTVAAFAGRHPNRVRSLTMVDPAAGPSGNLPWYFRIPLLGSALWQVLAVPGMADGQATDFVEPSRWPDWADRYRVQTRYRGFGRALRRTIAAGEATDLDSLYARVGANKVRSLLIWGTEDSTVSIALAPSVRAAIPEIEFHAVAKAGHLPHMERPDVVNPLLIGFLRPPPAPEATAPPTEGPP